MFERKKIEDCFDGSSVFEYCLSKNVESELVFKMKELGEWQFFEDFPRPFYKVVSNEGLHIKGVVGEKTIKVIFPNEKREDCCKKWEDFLLCEGC